MVFSSSANPHLRSFLDSIHVGVVKKYEETFRSNSEVVRALTVDRSIGMYEFFDAIGMPWSRVEQMEYDYGDEEFLD